MSGISRGSRAVQKAFYWDNLREAFRAVPPIGKVELDEKYSNLSSEEPGRNRVR